MDINKVKYNFDASDSLIPWCPKCRKQMSISVILYDMCLFWCIILLAVLALAGKAERFFFGPQADNIPKEEKTQIVKHFFLVQTPLFVLLAVKIIYGFRWWKGSKNSRKEF